jgi:regulator of nonsense transcripts 1
MIEKFGSLDEDQNKRFIDIKMKAEQEVLATADVVCSTCVTSADKRIKNLNFNIVLVDEATQACEPECKFW